MPDPGFLNEESPGFTRSSSSAVTQAALTARPAWAWLAERDGRPVGLVHVQPPEHSGWIAGMTRPGVTAYLQTMFVRPGERGGGVGAALVRYPLGCAARAASRPRCCTTRS